MIYLLWQGTLFLAAVRAVGELVILVVSFLASFILALIVLLVAKLIMSDILSSISLLLALYTSSLKPSDFTIWHSLLKQTGTASKLSTSYLSTLILKAFSYARTFF